MADGASDGLLAAEATPVGSPHDVADYGRRLPRRRFVSDMPDKGLFGIVAVFGFVAIVVLKLRHHDSNLVAGGAVALMLTYGLVAFRMPEVQLRLDRLGDNFYYLGFIYTLASMSAALLELGENSNNIEAVLGSFGIALFTTIVGVAGRVMFVQLRSEIDEVEAQVRRDLVEASDALRTQLHQALREFETFHTAVRQAADERQKDSQNAAEKEMELIRSVAQSAAREIQSAFAGNRTNATEVAKSVQNMDGAVQALIERVSTLELPTARLDRHVDQFGRGLEGLLQRFAQAIDEVGSAASLGARRNRRKVWWPFGR
jgi:F0F1-type ATP synthase membrane subunit b/b'